MEILYQRECFEIIGACMEVHKVLGYGFLENVYQEALSWEFLDRHIPFEREARLNIRFKNRILDKKYTADFLCFNGIIVELKAISALSAQNEAQTINYLKATGLRLGLLVNFGEPSLKFKRVIL